MTRRLTSALTLLLLSGLACAGPAMDASGVKQPTNWHAIIMFLIFVAMTMGITYWASGRTKSTADFYTAGGGITGFQNGLAIAGDYMSAATLLGLTAMTYTSGYDGYIYMLAFFAGWPIILFLMAERLRNLGRFTFAAINPVSYTHLDVYTRQCPLTPSLNSRTSCPTASACCLTAPPMRLPASIRSGFH